ncbi:uncharacterized protein LOC107264412 isoform X2 [Cephus cinctus]|uniref:Uncharacterized protein LOC107264412 isoform X2 n=1 Tax=Cephus cinctus TaxID=211228 RepID=A0AAJ7VY44_CEPCN|nr:uncharacterized protein LOC107264412 isoform X2 [Cephus cinctus]
MLCPARVKSHQRWRHFPQKSRVCTGVYTERVHKTRMPRGVFRRSFVSVGLLLMSAREQSVEPERMEMRDCHTNNWNNEALSGTSPQLFFVTTAMIFLCPPLRGICLTMAAQAAQ